MSRPGLLDDDHVRLFTWREIDRLFDVAGFAIEGTQIVPGEGYADWVEQGRPNELRVGQLQLSGLSREDIQHFLAYQYLVVARPISPPQRTGLPKKDRSSSQSPSADEHDPEDQNEIDAWISILRESLPESIESALIVAHDVTALGHAVKQASTARLTGISHSADTTRTHSTAIDQFLDGGIDALNQLTDADRFDLIVCDCLPAVRNPMNLLTGLGQQLTKNGSLAGDCLKPQTSRRDRRIAHWKLEPSLAAQSRCYGPEILYSSRDRETLCPHRLCNPEFADDSRPRLRRVESERPLRERANRTTDGHGISP